MSRIATVLLAIPLLVACSSPSVAPSSGGEDSATIEEDTAIEQEDAEEIDSGAPDTNAPPDTRPVDTGTKDTAPPPDTAPPGQKNVVSIGAGHTHTCLVLSDGTLRCTGENDSGQLGNGTTTRAFIPVKPTLSSALSVAGGYAHTCVRLMGNTVSCFGANDRGQLGDGTTTRRLTPTAVTGLTDVIQLAAGRSHTCALISDGTVKCWGYAYNGQVGDGTTTTRLSPVAVTGLSNVTHISLGSNHSCALLSDKTVKCWGDGPMLGNGFAADAKSPVLAAGLTDVRSLSVGLTHTCGVVGAPPANKVMCFGSNPFGQLGDGTLKTSDTPVQVVGISDVTDVASGGVFTCARLSGGSAKCWGSAQLGSMGDGTFAPTYGAKGGLVALSNMVELDAGAGQICARLPDTSIWCWGNNLNGYLGDGTSISRSLPVPMRATP